MAPQKRKRRDDSQPQTSSTKRATKKRKVVDDDDSDMEEQVVMRHTTKSKKRLIVDDDDVMQDSSDDEAYSDKKKKKVRITRASDSEEVVEERTVKKKRTSKKSARDSSASKTKVKASVKKSTTTTKKGSKVKKEEKKEEVFEWWNLPKDELDRLVNRGRNDEKWTTLKHNGPLMAPEYEPHGVKPIYKGKPVTLNKDEEEVATMYAVLKGHEYYTDKTFKKNFWNSFKEVMSKNNPLKKAKIEDVDFEPIYQWNIEKKAREKERTTEEKKALKEKKEKEEEKYKYCEIDGRKELVGNFRVEPPALFRGRGAHPLAGTLKKRVYPEDITINIGDPKDAPPPPPGHKWGAIITNKKVQWLSTWKDSINGDTKYVLLSRKASLKGVSDFKKFEKARELKGDLIKQIRKEYESHWNSKDDTVLQRAVAMYFIDKLALRNGNEKDTTKKADTVGCCSLKCEHIKLIKPSTIELDFLGKDSVPYHNSVEVPKKVFNLLKSFIKGKKKNEKIFDKISSSQLNAYLKEKLPGLTAKVFRTFNASLTLDQELRKNEASIKNKTEAEKVEYYNDANRQVAILCNHQKAISKNFDETIKRVDDTLEEHRDYLKRLKKAKKEWKKKGKDTLKDEWQKVQDKVQKKYDKELKAYEKEIENLKKKAKEANQSYALYLASNSIQEPKKPKKPPKRALPSSIEALEKRIDQQEKTVKKKAIEKQEKEKNKNVSLGTSKINYCDPRITCAFCKRNDIDIKRIFSKTLLEQFPWSTDVDEDFVF